MIAFTFPRASRRMSALATTELSRSRRTRSLLARDSDRDHRRRKRLRLKFWHGRLDVAGQLQLVDRTQAPKICHPMKKPRQYGGAPAHSSDPHGHPVTFPGHPDDPLRLPAAGVEP